MNMKKRIIISIFLAIFSFVLNIAVFVFCYNKLATPFLTEEQRALNADFIMSVTTGSFAVVSIIIGVLIFFVTKKNQHN